LTIPDLLIELIRRAEVDLQDARSELEEARIEYANLLFLQLAKDLEGSKTKPIGLEICQSKLQEAHNGVVECQKTLDRFKSLQPHLASQAGHSDLAGLKRKLLL
jgi:hypothetical protein